MYLTNYQFTLPAWLEVIFIFSPVDPRFSNFHSKTCVTQDYSFVKIFGEGDNRKIKVVLLKSFCEFSDKSNNRGVNDFKLEDNITRAKSLIFELAFCNPWEWFFTGTLDASKYNRSDLDKFHKDFTKWINNYNRLKGTNIKFLIIPELHKDMINWHFHGFLMNLPESHLHQFRIGDRMGSKIAKRVSLGYKVFNWLPFMNKFGFCDLEPIQNPEAVSKYVTKYINKDLGKSVTEVGAHMYYRSRGLKRSVNVAEGVLSVECPWTYENERVKVAWLPYSDELLQFLTIDDSPIRQVHYENYRLVGDFVV